MSWRSRLCDRNPAVRAEAYGQIDYGRPSCDILAGLCVRKLDMKTMSARILGAVVATAGALPIALIALPTAGAAPCPDVESSSPAAPPSRPVSVGSVRPSSTQSVRRSAAVRSACTRSTIRRATISAEARPPAERYERARSGDGRELPEHQNGARRIFARARRSWTWPPRLCRPMWPTTSRPRPCSAAAKHVRGQPVPGPLPSIGPLYAAKTIEMCVPNDPICFQGGWDMRAHGAYVQTGMVNDAAAFAASRI